MTPKLQLKHLSTEGKHLHIYYHRRCVFLFPLDIAVFAGTVMSKFTSHTWFQIYDVLRHLLVPCKTDLCLYAILQWHYNGRDDTSLTIVYLTVYSGADQRKHQSSTSLAFERGIHRSPVNSPHKWPVTRKMFPFDDVIMNIVFIIHTKQRRKRCYPRFSFAIRRVSH